MALGDFEVVVPRPDLQLDRACELPGTGAIVRERVDQRVARLRDRGLECDRIDLGLVTAASGVLAENPHGVEVDERVAPRAAFSRFFQQGQGVLVPSRGPQREPLECPCVTLDGLQLFEGRCRGVALAFEGVEVRAQHGVSQALFAGIRGEFREQPARPFRVPLRGVEERDLAHRVEREGTGREREFLDAFELWDVPHAGVHDGQGVEQAERQGTVGEHLVEAGGRRARDLHLAFHD